MTIEERAYRAGQRDAAAGRGLYFCGPADVTAAYLAGARSAPTTGTTERPTEAITEMPAPPQLTGRQLIAMMRAEMAADPDAIDEWAY